MNLAPTPPVPGDFAGPFIQTPPRPDTARAATLVTGPDTIILEGTTPESPWAYVQFQSGPVNEGGVNGVQVEDVIDIAFRRIAALHDALPCQENVNAMAHLSAARDWLDNRRIARTQQGVEGTSRPHRS